MAPRNRTRKVEGRPHRLKMCIDVAAKELTEEYDVGCFKAYVFSLEDWKNQGLFSKSIHGAETDYFGSISEDFDPF